MVLQLPTGYAVNMAMLLVFRFFTRFFGRPVLATGGATIADMYPLSKIAYGICIWARSRPRQKVSGGPFGSSRGCVRLCS